MFASLRYIFDETRLDTHGAGRRLLDSVAMALVVLALLPAGSALVGPQTCINPSAQSQSRQRAAATTMTPTARAIYFDACGSGGGGGGGAVANVNVYGDTRRASPAVRGTAAAAAWLGRSDHAGLGGAAERSAEQGQSDSPVKSVGMGARRRRLRSVGMTAGGAWPSTGRSGRFGSSSWVSARAARVSKCEQP